MDKLTRNETLKIIFNEKAKENIFELSLPEIYKEFLKIESEGNYKLNYKNIQSKNGYSKYQRAIRTALGAENKKINGLFKKINPNLQDGNWKLNDSEIINNKIKKFKEESKKIILNDYLIEENNKEYVTFDGKRISRNYANVVELREYVNETLKGKCESCNNDLFIKENGDVYFEAHHIKFLYLNGKDTKENMIPLCPNCHKKAHFSKEMKQLKEKFLSIARNRENF